MGGACLSTTPLRPGELSEGKSLFVLRHRIPPPFGMWSVLLNGGRTTPEELFLLVPFSYFFVICSAVF